MMRMLDNAVEKIENRFCGMSDRSLEIVRLFDIATIKLSKWVKDKKCLVKCCLKMNWIGKQQRL